MKLWVPIAFLFIIALTSASLFTLQVRSSISLPKVKLPPITTLPTVIKTLIIPNIPGPTIIKVTPLPTRKPTANHPKSTINPGNCYRFRVPHLDGSSSFRCYLARDYTLLVSLQKQLSSAQKSRQFDLDSVAEFQREFDRTGATNYLDAKASSQAQADSENSKIGSISLTMFQIEARGW